MFLQGRRNLLYGWWVKMSPAMVGQWRRFLKLHWIKCLKTVSKKRKLGPENYSKPHIWSLLNSDFQVQSLSQHSPKTYLKYFQQTCPWLVPGKRYWLYFSEGVIFSQYEIIWQKTNTNWQWDHSKNSVTCMKTFLIGFTYITSNFTLSPPLCYSLEIIRGKNIFCKNGCFIILCYIKGGKKMHF